MSLGAFFYSYYWYFILTWVPSYLLTVHGYSNLKMGTILSVPLAVTAVTSLVAGRVADKVIKKTGAAPLTVRKAFVTGRSSAAAPSSSSLGCPPAPTRCCRCFSYPWAAWASASPTTGR